MPNLEDTLQSMAATVSRAPRLVRLHEVVQGLARRLGQPIDVITRHVLQHLQHDGAAVDLYLLDHAEVPHVVPRGSASRAEMLDDVRRRLSRGGGPGAALAVHGLSTLPRERGPLLEALAEWWCGHRPRARARGVAEVALSVSDAISQLGHADRAKPATLMAPAVDASAPACLAAEPDQLRSGAPRFDASCIALYRERAQLEGSARPMQHLVSKYGLSDGHLRKCIRHGEALLGPVATGAAPRSVFDLAAQTVRPRRAA